METRNFNSRVFALAALVVSASALAASGDIEDALRDQMAAINLVLACQGEDVRVAAVEYYTAWNEAGQTVFFDDRTLRWYMHWVPFDPRRGGWGDIAWLSDLVDGEANGLSLLDTQAAVSRAMNTWNSLTCAEIPLTQLPDFGIDWGYVQYLLGFGGFEYGWFADITHAGWLPGLFFEAIEPGGGTSILGITYTFIWVDEDDRPTDIDNNRMYDTAFSETYYNDAFLWGTDTYVPIDVETVVLHETGHSLSLDHFGKLFRTDANGMFHFAPRAVMNAGYTGPLQEVTATDLGAFCSVWGSWPLN